MAGSGSHVPVFITSLSRCQRRAIVRTAHALSSPRNVRMMRQHVDKIQYSIMCVSRGKHDDNNSNAGMSMSSSSTHHGGNGSCNVPFPLMESLTHPPCCVVSWQSHWGLSSSSHSDASNAFDRSSSSRHEVTRRA